MKNLIAELNKIAPSIAIETIWSHDLDADFKDLADCNCGPRKNWRAWQSEVKATAINGGLLITGNAYLGGTWERAGKHPSKSNPEISGYLPQMIEEALIMLGSQCRKTDKVLPEIHAAIAAVKAEMKRSYDEQMSKRAA